MLWTYRIGFMRVLIEIWSYTSGCTGMEENKFDNLHGGIFVQPD